MQQIRLKAVIFDLDGVITDTAEYHYIAWKEIADRLKIPFDKEYNEKLKGVSRLESLELILNNSEKQYNFSNEEKKELMYTKNAIYKRLIKQITKEDLLPGIKSFFDELRENGIKIGLASVSNNAGYIVKRLSIESYFDFIANPEIITRTKPFPDLFEASINYFMFKAEECIGIEDARKGIEAIHRAGMLAVGVGLEKEMEEADLYLSSTNELSLSRIKEKLNFV